MPTKIFLTSITGYISGTVLHTLYRRFPPPEHEYTVLIRSTPPSGFAAAYPHATVLAGDYDSAALLSDAARQCDIVIHTGSDHLACISSLLSGLRPSSHLIHLSGTDTLQPAPAGHAAGWSDVSDLDTIRALPSSRLHQAANLAVLGAGKRTAVLAPPDVYGPGLGPGRRQSFTTPHFVRRAVVCGRAFCYPAAQDGAQDGGVHSYVHIADLMRLYVKLVESAVEHGGGGADWGKDGFYFVPSAGDLAWRAVAAKVGEILHRRGLVERPEPLLVEVDESVGKAERLGIELMYAGTCMTRAERAEKLWGLRAQEKSYLECLEEDVVAALDSPEGDAGDMAAYLEKGVA